MSKHDSITVHVNRDGEGTIRATATQTHEDYKPRRLPGYMKGGQLFPTLDDIAAQLDAEGYAPLGGLPTERDHFDPRDGRVVVFRKKKEPTLHERLSTSGKTPAEGKPERKPDPDAERRYAAAERRRIRTGG